LSCNLGTLTSWNPLGHSRPVTGLLYLYLLQNVNRQQLAKTKHTKGCNKEIIVGKQWRNTELQDVRKKEYTNKRRRYLSNVVLRNWNV
jgi:hypothetical protein